MKLLLVTIVLFLQCNLNKVTQTSVQSSNYSNLQYSSLNDFVDKFTGVPKKPFAVIALPAVETNTVANYYVSHRHFKRSRRKKIKKKKKIRRKKHKKNFRSSAPISMPSEKVTDKPSVLSDNHPGSNGSDFNFDIKNPEELNNSINKKVNVTQAEDDISRSTPIDTVSDKSIIPSDNYPNSYEKNDTGGNTNDVNIYIEKSENNIPNRKNKEEKEKKIINDEKSDVLSSKTNEEPNVLPSNDSVSNINKVSVHIKPHKKTRKKHKEEKQKEKNIQQLENDAGTTVPSSTPVSIDVSDKPMVTSDNDTAANTNRVEIYLINTANQI